MCVYVSCVNYGNNCILLIYKNPFRTIQDFWMFTPQMGFLNLTAVIPLAMLLETLDLDASLIHVYYYIYI